MKKFVVYNGGIEPDLLRCTAPNMLVKGERYEVLEKRFYDEGNAYTLKDIKGEFDAKWFDDENESIIAQNKPVYFAKAVVYGDIINFIGRMFRLNKLVKEKYKMITTEPIINIEHVYSSVYKIETEYEVYITYVVKRTVG